MSRDSLDERYIWARYRSIPPRELYAGGDWHREEHFRAGLDWVRHVLVDCYGQITMREIAYLMREVRPFTISVLTGVGEEQNLDHRYSRAQFLRGMLHELRSAARSAERRCGTPSRIPTCGAAHSLARVGTPGKRSCWPLWVRSLSRLSLSISSASRAAQSLRRSA